MSGYDEDCYVKRICGSAGHLEGKMECAACGAKKVAWVSQPNQASQQQDAAEGTLKFKLMYEFKELVERHGFKVVEQEFTNRWRFGLVFNNDKGLNLSVALDTPNGKLEPEKKIKDV